MRAPKIAVIGAGIAGLTTAVFLHQAGLPCRVFEQARDLRVLGAGLQLSPNAVRVLHGIGLGPDLQRDAVAIHTLSFLRWSDDTPLAYLPLGQHGVHSFGAPYYGIHRADLHRALLGRFPEDVLELGTECIEIQQDGNLAHIQFATGHGADADLVIGADGIHSKVRGGLAKDAPRYTGHIIYRGLVEAERVPLLAKVPNVRLWLGPGRHLVSYPICAGRLLYFGATAPLERWIGPQWSVAAKRDQLAEAYRGWSDTVQTLISAAREVTCWALHDRAPLRRWQDPQTVLVGDAAHSMLPFMAQAANQAIEDAAVLVSCLRASSSPGWSLVHYERTRRSRVDRIHRLSRDNAALFHLTDGAAQRRRDRTFQKLWTRDSLAWLFGHDPTRNIKHGRSLHEQ